LPERWPLEHPDGKSASPDELRARGQTPIVANAELRVTDAAVTGRIEPRGDVGAPIAVNLGG